MKAADGQNTFVGGMNDRISPERLGDTEYAYGENGEIRDGTWRTRRGSFRVYDWRSSATVRGVGVYRSPVEMDRNESILIARDAKIYRCRPANEPTYMTLPAANAANIMFVQAFNRVYALRGASNDIWRWDGGADNTWAALATPDAGDKAPNAAYGIFAYNRMWLVIDGDVVAPSDLLSEAFELTYHQYQINSGEGESISALAPFSDGRIVVFKDGSTHLMTGCNGDLSGLSVDVLDARHGCIAPHSVVTVGQDVWFLSDDGVRSVQLTQYNKAESVDIPLSWPVPHLFARVNMAAASQAKSVVFDNYFICAVPIDGSQTLNAAIVYDLVLKCWVGLWTGTGEQYYVVDRQFVDERLFGITGDGDVIQLLADYSQDLVPAQKAIVTLPDTADPQWTYASGTTQLATAGNTKGAFLISCRAISTTDGMNVQFRNDAGTSFLWFWVLGYQVAAYCFKAGVTQWSAQTAAGALDATNFDPDVFHSVAIVQDGTEPYLLVDGAPIAWTFTISVDKAAWFNVLTDPAGAGKLRTVHCKRANVGHLWYANWFKVLDADNEPLFVQPFQEGSGASAVEVLGSVQPTVTQDWSALWVAASAAEIATELKTRGFKFQSDSVEKRLNTCEITIGHRNCLLSASALTNKPGETDALVSAQEYDKTAYDLYGAAAWTGTGATFNDEHRQDYTPVTLGATGMALTANGIYLDRETEHTLKLRSSLVAPWFQFDITNARGAVSIRNLMATASTRKFGNRSNE